MPVFHFESKAAQHKRLMQQFATRLGQEAAKDFKYNPESDPVMKDIFNKLGLLRSRKRCCKS
ncbi:MAG TPA: hypothetical protein VFC58_16630 [Desulfosporosinus sp.]|nr:hypothetical protein [Desulfosporosinus sp.]